MCPFTRAHSLAYTDYYEFFGPDFKLHPNVTAEVVNQNTHEYLHKIRECVEENLRHITHAPSVLMHEVSMSSS